MKTFNELREELENINEDRDSIVDYADLPELEGVERILRDDVMKLVSFNRERVEKDGAEGLNVTAEIKKFGLSLKAFSRGSIMIVEPDIYEKGKKISSFGDLGFNEKPGYLRGKKEFIATLMQHVLVRSALVFAKPLKAKAQKALDKVRKDNEEVRQRDSMLRNRLKK